MQKDRQRRFQSDIISTEKLTKLKRKLKKSKKHSKKHACDSSDSDSDSSKDSGSVAANSDITILSILAAM